MAEHDSEALWQAVNDLRVKVEMHAVKHAESDGRLNLLAAGVAEVKNAVDHSRRERTAQFEEIVARLDKLDSMSAEIIEERGAKKLRTQLISWGIAIASALGLGAWIHQGGGK